MQALYRGRAEFHRCAEVVNCAAVPNPILRCSYIPFDMGRWCVSFGMVCVCIVLAVLNSWPVLKLYVGYEAIHSSYRAGALGCGYLAMEAALYYWVDGS